MSKFKQICKTIQKNIFVVLLVATISVVLSVGYVTIYTSPTYSATAKVLVHNGNLNEINAENGVETKISATDTCLEIFNSPDIFAFLKSNVMSELPYTSEQLNDIIKVTAEGDDSLVFYVTSICDNPEDAVKITRDYSNMMYSYIAQFVNRAFVNPLYIDTVATPIKPDVTLTVILSLLAGALLGAVGTIVLSHSNRRLKNANDFKSRYSVKILGVVPNFENEGGKNSGR